MKAPDFYQVGQGAYNQVGSKFSGTNQRDDQSSMGKRAQAQQAGKVQHTRRSWMMQLQGEQRAILQCEALGGHPAKRVCELDPPT